MKKTLKFAAIRGIGVLPLLAAATNVVADSWTFPARRSDKVFTFDQTKIEYELKFQDYLLFTVLHQFLSVPVQLLFGGLAVFVFYASINGSSLFASTTGAMFAYVAMWAAQLLFNVFYLSFGKNRSLLTKHIVEIQDDAFHVETKFSRSHNFWAGLAKVISRPGFIAVYLNSNAAHIIPARAFSSPEQRQDFLAALKGKLTLG